MGIHAESPEPSVPAVRLRGIGKSLGYHTVLRDVSFAVSPGEMVGLVGPNGAGKSTLLKVLATLLRPASGEGFVHGRSLQDERDAARALTGYLGHGSGLYDGLTVRENLLLAGRLYGVRDLSGRVAAAVKEAHLQAHESYLVRHLSKGLARRLALERTLLHDPPLLLLDEPFDGLDQEAQHRLSERLHRHQHDGGTVILVTHDLAMAQALCRRALVLSGGRLLRDVDAAETPITAEMMAGV